MMKNFTLKRIKPEKQEADLPAMLDKLDLKEALKMDKPYPAPNPAGRRNTLH